MDNTYFLHQLFGYQTYRIYQLQKQLSESQAREQQLTENNHGLRDEVDRLRYLSRPSRLLERLPAKIRVMIWGLCVAPGKYFLKPRPTHDRRYKDMEEFFEPEWQLFLVNRLVRAEALEVFFRENHIVVNDEPRCRLLLEQPWTDGAGQAFSLFSAKHMTSISVSFDMRGLSAPSSNPLTWANSLRQPATFLLNVPNATWAALTLQQRMEYAHDILSANVSFAWSQILLHATGSLSWSPPSALRFLQIDVTNCYCRQGCCRAVARAAEGLARCRFEESLEKIEILGTKTEAERNLFIDSLIGSRRESLATCQPKLTFRAFELEGRTDDLNTLHLDGLDTQLGDAEVDMASLWRQHLADVAEEDEE
ncbi:hypothetical protein M409DRAFT_19713 [Zasmidium cellare ATCC 36951]|uniref:Uncharacterized protein n=1 Tax=Zasmidium cellare ATCC 36951 TaxID=1080233 RepID=A0A6A6CS51_ZASCE|nr:uncharacterized protein M409DRAFT_19713 [Zasmidium cellare ATCC 36951]KAF2170107.1 hypothetical protein M409DRAFT_19713 [Zasmidium cellare ATCC 36951]